MTAQTTPAALPAAEPATVAEAKQAWLAAARAVGDHSDSCNGCHCADCIERCADDVALRVAEARAWDAFEVALAQEAAS